MKKLSILLLLCTLAYSCKENKESTTTNVSEAQQENTDAAQNDDGWISLFDGTSMDAWRGYGSDSMANGWSIEDGNLTYTPGQKGPNDIITKEKYTDFELSVDWKISEGGNSGIFWSVEERKDQPIYVSALEIQVLDDERHPDAKNGTSHQAGALYDLVSPTPGLVKPAGEWNTCYIYVNHKTNEGYAMLNGKKVVSFPLHGEQWDAMVAKSKFKDWSSFGVHHTGYIGLQDHGDKVWYKNIKIKPL